MIWFGQIASPTAQRYWIPVDKMCFFIYENFRCLSSCMKLPHWRKFEFRKCGVIDHNIQPTEHTVLYTKFTLKSMALHKNVFF